MRIAKLELFSPHGGKITVVASDPRKSLMIDRNGMELAIVEIRDYGLEAHEDGKARLVAQVPSSWAIVPMWEHDKAASPPDLRSVKASVRHSGAVIPSPGCECLDCIASRERLCKEKAENRGELPTGAGEALGPIGDTSGGN